MPTGVLDVTFCQPELTLNLASKNRFKAPGSEGKLLLWLKDVERAIDHVAEVSRLGRYLGQEAALTVAPRSFYLP